MPAVAAHVTQSAHIPRVLGRYEIVGILGRGGMATVYLGRVAGEAGFSRLFAIKVLHPHLADESSFVAMLLDEAQIAARLHHPNVVPIVDSGSEGDLRYVVLEYVEGYAFSALLSKYRDSRPARLIVPIVIDALAGLQAAHALSDDDGNPLRLVHRDVTPQNILVGADGAARITDFGVAKAASSINMTVPGQIKGKFAFMSPEQIRGLELDQRSDIFSAGCLLWSALTGRRLFLGSSDAATMSNILEMEIPRPSAVGLMPPAVFDSIVLRALERDRDKRWASASEMEEALREAALHHGLLGQRREVADWVSAAFGEELKARRVAVREATSKSRSGPTSESQPVSAMSGLRVIPGAGAFTPSRPSEFGTENSSSSSSSAQYQAPMAPAPSTAKRRLGLVAILAGAVVASGLGVWLLMRPAASPPAPPTANPTGAGASTAAPVAAAPPASAPANPATPPVASAPPTTATAPSPQAAPLAVAPAVQGKPAVDLDHPKPSGAVKVPATTWKPPPPSKPVSNPSPQSAPSPATTGNAAAWTPDSPLPPQ